MKVHQWATGAEPLAGSKLEKHWQLYTLETHFVRHTWCKNDETVTLTGTLYMGEGVTKFSHRICVDLTGASDCGWGGGPGPWTSLASANPVTRYGHYAGEVKDIIIGRLAVVS